MHGGRRKAGIVGFRIHIAIFISSKIAMRENKSIFYIKHANQ